SARDAVNTLETPSSFAACAATASGESDRTSTSIVSGFNSRAQVTQRAVAAVSWPFKCSATIRILDMRDFRFLAGASPARDSVASQSRAGALLQQHHTSPFCFNA